eukprot:CAMPEP_0178953870 /NCGR_PEP_ID=MMETSP0789-20121207/8664_1 /TAXON_ID=3005 /ORGANISM="Rhizosolenia setigera, Strain CCMP 1694" /LENGTH=510 /DNA_ID=CAMNT_0020635187 /DNA_START=249 /DNA_END=1781 /DNA_ORIENTATION=+
MKDYSTLGLESPGKDDDSIIGCDPMPEGFDYNCMAYDELDGFSCAGDQDSVFAGGKETGCKSAATETLGNAFVDFEEAVGCNSTEAIENAFKCGEDGDDIVRYSIQCGDVDFDGNRSTQLNIRLAKKWMRLFTIGTVALALVIFSHKKSENTGYYSRASKYETAKAKKRGNGRVKIESRDYYDFDVIFEDGMHIEGPTVVGKYLYFASNKLGVFEYNLDNDHYKILVEADDEFVPHAVAYNRFNGKLVVCSTEDSGLGSVFEMNRDGSGFKDLAPDTVFNSPNDLVVSKDGIIWFTDPFWLRSSYPPPAGGTSGLWSINRHHQVTLEYDFGLAGQPNGIALAKDERKLYVSLTGRNMVEVFKVGRFEFTKGRTPVHYYDQLESYRRFCHGLALHPDGMKIKGDYILVAHGENYLQALLLDMEEEQEESESEDSNDYRKEKLPAFKISVKGDFKGIRNFAIDDSDDSIYMLSPDDVARITPKNDHYKRKKQDWPFSTYVYNQEGDDDYAYF